MCLLLVWRVCDQALANIGRCRVPKSGHVTITKNENLHIGTRRKIHRFQKCYSFRSTTKNNEVIAEKNRFRTVASPGACGCLAVLNWRSSSIHASSNWALLSCPASCWHWLFFHGMFGFTWANKLCWCWLIARTDCISTLCNVITSTCHRWTDNLRQGCYIFAFVFVG